MWGVKALTAWPGLDSLTTCGIKIYDYLHIFKGERLWVFLRN